MINNTLRNGIRFEVFNFCLACDKCHERLDRYRQTTIDIVTVGGFYDGKA